MNRFKIIFYFHLSDHRRSKPKCYQYQWYKQNRVQDYISYVWRITETQQNRFHHTSTIAQCVCHIILRCYKIIIFTNKNYVLWFRGRPTNAVVVWKPKPVIELVRSFSNYPQEPESTVVITEITDDEEKELNNDDEMFVEDNK